MVSRYTEVSTKVKKAAHIFGHTVLQFYAIFNENLEKVLQLQEILPTV